MPVLFSFRLNTRSSGLSIVPDVAANPGIRFRKSLSLQKMGLTGLISVLPATSTIIGANSVAARLS
jgi:hypothetical protein